eukprot:CAMPEP_0118968384 /NCGR_PEP_ID=MMETSP1173-20130426/5605_1 /TAXON_ID=1034831 /ORGANISM="Rhizochromulina marina cf, Strain CCMP1243" /LENGTH=78 /DNA_ID=CAMNT_0006917485 /DNA_START=345 /DNA_END=581 /DNA_ORIENTATION=+
MNQHREPAAADASPVPRVEFQSKRVSYRASAVCEKGNLARGIRGLGPSAENKWVIHGYADDIVDPFLLEIVCKVQEPF